MRLPRRGWPRGERSVWLGVLVVRPPVRVVSLLLPLVWAACHEGGRCLWPLALLTGALAFSLAEGRLPRLTQVLWELVVVRLAAATPRLAPRRLTIGRVGGGLPLSVVLRVSVGRPSQRRLLLVERSVRCWQCGRRRGRCPAWCSCCAPRRFWGGVFCPPLLCGSPWCGGWRRRHGFCCAQRCGAGDWRSRRHAAPPDPKQPSCASLHVPVMLCFIEQGCLLPALCLPQRRRRQNRRTWNVDTKTGRR